MTSEEVGGNKMYVVGLHSYGGSAGEAMEPQEIVTVETLAEAEIVVKAIMEHPLNKHGYYGGVITAVADSISVSDALDKIFSNYLFEEGEIDFPGADKMSEEEYWAECKRLTSEWAAQFLAENV